MLKIKIDLVNLELNASFLLNMLRKPII